MYNLKVLIILHECRLFLEDIFFYVKNYLLFSKYYSKANKNMLFTHHQV